MKYLQNIDNTNRNIVIRGDTNTGSAAQPIIYHNDINRRTMLIYTSGYSSHFSYPGVDFNYIQELEDKIQKLKKSEYLLREIIFIQEEKIKKLQKEAQNEL